MGRGEVKGGEGGAEKVPLFLGKLVEYSRLSLFPYLVLSTPGLE